MGDVYRKLSDTIFLFVFFSTDSGLGEESAIGGDTDSPGGGGKKMSWKKAVLSAVQGCEDTAVPLPLQPASDPHLPIQSSSHAHHGANGRPDGWMETDVAIITINSVMATVFMRNKGLRKWVPMKKDVWIFGGHHIEVRLERRCILTIVVTVNWAY